MRISLTILGTEVIALQVGADPAPEPDTMRYDPTSTTACSTETSYPALLGFHIGANPSLNQSE
jgi:hypothetical protein